MNLEFVLYDHHTPYIIESKNKMEKEVTSLNNFSPIKYENFPYFLKTDRQEETPHVPHEPPFENDGAHCDDDVDD